MVKLKSGREVEYKPLNKLEAGEVQDINQAYYLEHPVTKGKTLSLRSLIKTVMFCCSLSVDELSDWKDEEITELAMMIWQDSFLLETDKKK